VITSYEKVMPSMTIKGTRFSYCSIAYPLAHLQIVHMSFNFYLGATDVTL
jgi:hypothetical protein